MLRAIGVHRLRTVALQSTAIAGLTLLTAAPASAQTSLAPPSATGAASGDGPADDIVVTGSRVSGRGSNTPTPVTALTAADIAQRAPATLADTLITIPSFRPSNTPSTSGVNSRGGGLVSADLRGLGATRTLVLVDGRRFVPSGTDGVVDLKLVPSLLIDRLEVVTGGASAAYGSDAVAGVVNFRLKQKISGVEASIQTGISQRGDNAEYRASLATGGSLLDDRLTFVAGGDYLKSEGIGNQYTRGWGRKEVGLISNTAFATNGLPQYIIAGSVHPSNLSPGGLIVSGPLRGTQFGPNGTTSTFNFGQLFGSSMIGGDNVGNNLSNATQLSAPYEAKVVMGHANFELIPAITVFGEVSGAWSTSSGNSQQPRDAGTLTIAVDNAYLPESVRSAMVANRLSTITVGRLYNDSGPIGINIKNRTIRAVGGARGDLGGSWKWDAYYQYGRNHYTVETGPNNRLVANFTRAIDAVRSPTTGAVVCRSTLTNPTNGCVPQNIFGDGSVVVDNYSFGTARFDLFTRQKVASANLNGDIFSTWAGPVSIAVGAEYRKEEATSTSNPLSTQVQPNGSIGAFQIGNQIPIIGEYHTKEVYGEAVVPLLRDSSLGKAFDLNGAVRRTDYSTSGPVTTWKVGATYEPISGLRFRGTRSRDIRAPNLGELYQAGGSSFVNVFDRVLNQTVQVREVVAGNTQLQPEKADTWTGGFAYQPDFVRNLTLSIDYYRINIKQAIGSISTPLAVTRCNAGLTQFCSQIVYNPNGTILNTIAQSLNLNAFKTSGVDFEARYDFRIGAGRVSTHALGTYVDKLITVDSSGANDRVGTLSQFQRVTGVPHFTGVFDLTYSINDSSINLQTRLIGRGKYSNILVEGAGAANTINDNSVPAVAYLSLSLTQGVQTGLGKVQFFGVINNLLDRDPPLVPAGSIGGANETSTNPAFYDVIGRTFKVGARFAF